MEERKEIKLTPEEFDATISSLVGNRNELSSARDTLVNANSDMEHDWIGDGGTAFTLSAKVIEEKYKERIKKLEGEINDLLVAKMTMKGLDEHIADKIKDSIKAGSSGNANDQVTI